MCSLSYLETFKTCSIIKIPCALIIADLPAPAARPLAPLLGLNIGAFFNMSGTIRKRIMLPRINTCSNCDIYKK